MTYEEEERLDNLTNPLFQLMLRFESAFARLAIDRYDISNEDAEKVAVQMESTDTDGGRAFAYLMRRIPNERVLRKISYMVSAVWASEGSKRGMSLTEIGETYAKLPKGDA